MLIRGGLKLTKRGDRKPGDAEAFGAAVALTAVMVGAGTLVPTLRALRVDPIRAIRSE